jgi:hypothetical protein
MGRISRKKYLSKYREYAGSVQSYESSLVVQAFCVSKLSYGIVRGRGKWPYASMVGRRSYTSDCAVSVLPPKSLVAQSELLPGWKEIKNSYPDAEDAFSSPAHDLILIFYQNRLMVAPVQQGKIGKPLLRLEVNGKPVMAEWALGKHVDAWTNQLTPYCGVYQPKAKTSQWRKSLLLPLRQLGMNDGLTGVRRAKPACCRGCKSPTGKEVANPS